jgi:hypothetical protein
VKTLLIAAALLLGAAPLRGQSSPELVIDWLRALAAEAPFDLTDSDPNTQPRLYTERMDDGRTWLEYAVDSLGAAAGGDPADAATANEWARLDEAVALLLAEADKMKIEAAQRAGTAAEADFNTARRKYLAGAARLLKFYSTAAGDVFDATAGALNPLALPDWQMPAEIQLHNIAGAARLNVRTGEFSGRLSGNMEIPAFDTMLDVPNLSFDSRGNFDLTAFGTTELPPGDTRAVTLTIPARRPLMVHFSDDGDFRVAGGVQLDLPDGIRLDAFFDVDDPRYEFGLGFAGGVTLKLAKEIALIRPVVNFTAAAPLTVEALRGFSQFFGSLGKGFENFLADSPDLPDPASFDVGRPPEFEVPESVVPFDAIDAWITALGNDVVRPAINGSINVTLQHARNIIAGMRAEVAAVQTQLTPAIPEIQQLARIVELNAEARNMAALAAAQQALGVDSTRIQEDIRATAEDSAGKAKAWLQGLNANVELKTGLAILRLYVDAAAEASLAGSNENFDPVLAATKIAAFRARVLGSFGVNASGAISDAAKVAALSPADLRLAVTTLIELDVMEQLLGPSTGLPMVQAVSRILFERLRDQYNIAVTRGDIEQRAVLSMRLLDLASDQEDIGFTVTDAELQFMTNAWTETFDVIAARGSGGATGKKLAGSFMEAARGLVSAENRAVMRRRHDLFAETQKKDVREESLGLAERTFLQKVRSAMNILEGRGLLTSIVLSGYKSRLADWLEFSRQRFADNFPVTAAVERNLEEASNTLIELADMLAFLDDLVPENVQLLGAFQSTWQALHIKWTGVAELRKAHWYFAAYARELAAAISRYGDGTSAALTNSFRVAGTEAVAGLSRTVTALAAIFDTVGLEDFAFPLPGDLRIDRASGRVVFNRLTGDWEVGFGAKLGFPDSDFTLDVRNATLAKNGDFSLSLGTAGNVPLGGSSKINYTVANFTASGNTAQSFQFDGSGTLTYDGSTRVGDEFSVGLGVGFDSQTGVVNLNANLNNSPLRFSEDIVLLQGAAGVTFGTQSPQGALTVSGKLGILARSKPLPAPGLTAQNFWLTIDALPTTFIFSETDVRAEFTGGSISLPPDLFTSTAQPGDLPVTVAITGRLCLRYIFATGQVEFCSDPGAPFTLALTNLKLALPELPGFQLLISNTTFELSGTQFPLLKNLTASVTVPLPGADAANAAQNRSGTFIITAQNWRIDGLPEAASIGIGQDLRLADFSGFTVDVLAGSAFSLASNNGSPRRLTIGLTGGMKAGFDQRALNNDSDGTAVFLTGNGTFTWDMHSLPAVQDLALALEGDFRLGAGGPRITGQEDGQLARVAVANVQSLFNQTNDPVIISLEGAVDIPDLIKVGLVNSRFILRGNGLELEPGGIAFALRGQTLEAAKDVLPVYLSDFKLTFDQQLPIVPAVGQPGLFDIDNLIFTFSGGVNFPNGAAVEAGSPGISGTVQDLELRLNRQPNGVLLPEFNVDGITLQVKNLDIPPLGGIQGGIGILNLSQLSLDPPHPERVTFVGELGCDFNGVGAGILLAASPAEIHGLCLRASGGPAGIPIDGGVLGGVLWTGAEGGIHFKDSFSNPCEFESYIQPDHADEFPGEGDPRLQDNALEDPIVESEKDPNNPEDPPGDLYTKPGELPENGGNFDPFDCLKDNWPPQAANPLCEPSPTGSGRDVFIGSHMTTQQADAFLDSIGLTANDTRSADKLATDIIVGMLSRVTTQGQTAVNNLIAISGQQGNQKVIEHFNRLTDKIVASFDDAARPMLLAILEPAVGGGGSVRNEIRTLLTQGIPCFNVTFLGSGTFTHAAVSAIMDVKGTVSMSTTGAALARGELRLIGIPVAEASMGVSLTNRNNKISPFMGGLARVGLGPIELGKMTMSAAMPDATAVLDHFDALLNCVGTVLTTGAQNHMKLLMEAITRQPMPAGMTVQQFLQSRNEQERMAMVASLFNFFALSAQDRAGAGVLGYVQKLPAHLRLIGADLESLLACFETFVAATLNSLTPELCFGGKISPSIFDIPMTASGQDSASARMRFGPALRIPAEGESQLAILGDPAANLRPGAPPALREFSAYMQFSPTAAMLAPLTGVAVALNPTFAPFAGFTAVDSAEFGMSFQVEAWTQQKVHDFLFDPLKFYSDRTQEFFDTAVFSAGYSMSPFGMQLADAQMRVMFPRQEFHPLNPLNTARRDHPPMPPFTGARPIALPTAEELILAAISGGRLKDASWRGEVDQLDDLFPPPPAVPPTDGCADFTNQVSAQLRALDPGLVLLKQKSFAKDYFPYGGMLGGGELAMPKLLTQGLPPQWFTLLTRSDALLTGFTNQKGQEFLTALGDVMTFLGSTECVGQLGFYLPAPNPVLLPGETQIDWSQMTVDSLMRRLQTDPAALIGRSINSDLYELDEIVFAGWTNAKLLGIDLTQAKVSYANRTFLATAQIPPNPPTGTDTNWFNDFFSGSAEFRLGLPKDQQVGLVTYAASDLFNHIGSQITQMRTLSGAALQNRINEVQNSLIGAMPKISMELNGGVQIPPFISEFISAQANAGITMFAYSPFFDPAFSPADQSGQAVAKRRGGAGLCGNIRLGYFPGGQEVFGVNVSQACLTVAAPSAGGLLPAVIGDFNVPSFLLPGGFAFSGSAHFASDPDVNKDFLSIAGQMSPILLSNFLHITPLAAGQTQLGGTLHVTRTAGAPAVGLTMSPAKVTLPVLGSIAGKIYGASPASDFSFSSVSGQAWTATIELDGALVIRDPFNAAADIVFRASAAAGAKFFGQVDGVGLDTYTIKVQIPNGLTVELFPGKAHGSKFTIGDNSVSCLFVKSDGTIYYDSGTRTLPLGGPTPALAFASLAGRVEFGFNPPAPAPTVAFGEVGTFSAAIGQTHEQLLSVTASGGAARGRVIVDASTSTNGQWSVEPARLIVGAGKVGNFKVRYQPTSTGQNTQTLTLTEVRDGSTVNTNRSLTGIPLTGPIVHLSTSTVDFGTVPLNRTDGKVLRISNLGNAAVNVTVPAAAAPFALNGSGSVAVPANGTADVVFTFHPVAAGAASTPLTIVTDSEDFPSLDITLQGNGANLGEWIHFRRGDGTDVLRAAAVRIGSPSKIQATGENGVFLENGASGFVWERKTGTDGADLRAIILPSATLGWAAGNNGKVFKSTNGGTSWIGQSNAILTGDDWRAVATISSATGFVAFAGTVKGKTDGVIVRQTATATFATATVPAGTKALNGIAFTSSTNGIAVGETGTILRSTDGGASWAARPLPAGVPGSTILRDVAAVNVTTLIIVGDAGTVLRSTDSGATWVIIAVPTTEDLNSVAMQNISGSTSGLAVGNRGVIMTTVNGSSWTVEDSGTIENLTGAAISLAPVVVSEAGDILSKGSRSAGPAASIQNNINRAAFDNMTTGQGSYGDIIVSNHGGVSLKASATSSNPAFVLTPSGDQSVEPGNTLRFTLSFVSAGVDASTDITITTDDFNLPSTVLNVGGKGKAGVTETIAALHGPASVDLGFIPLGATRSAQFTIQNLGQRSANIARYGIRADNNDFTVTGTSGTLAVNGTRTVTASFTARIPGVQRAIVEIFSDAWNGMMPVEVTATVVPVPEQIVLRSNASGVVASVDGPLFDLPAVFTITDDVPDVANGLIQRGSPVTVIAPATVGTGANRREFDAWNAGATTALTFTPGASSRVLTANYDRTLTAGPAVDNAPVIPPTCTFVVPSDTPAGPWVKVSGARLTLPWLGDAAGGTRFRVEGSAFFSLSRGDASLTSSGVRVRVPNNSALFGQLANREVLEITPGSWKMAYVNDTTAGEGSFSILAGNPGLQIFNESVLPPASLSATIQSNLAGPLGNASVSFATRDDLPLVPLHLALGASSFSGQIGLFANQPVLNLSASTMLRAIANGAGGYHINRPFSFVFDPALPAIAPLSVTAGTEFLNLGFVRLLAGTGNATIGPSVTATGFQFGATNWNLKFFNSPDALTVSTFIDSSGVFSLSGALPPAGILPFSTSIFRLKPVGDTSFFAQIEPLRARVQAHWPSLFVNTTLTSGNSVWDADVITLPKVDFDTANLAVRIPLPGFDFGNGFDVTRHSSKSPDNCLELGFTSGATFMKLRERNDFFIGAMRRDFDVSNGGVLTGTLHGRLGLSGPPPLENANEQISFTYSNIANPSFVASRSMFLVGARFKLGRSGFFPTGRACVLTPAAGAVSTWLEALCAP